ncbi:VanZ family protein [Photobacterium swingsii]|uniref:VanZ family protein n=1 Tax=Photobacterium swingsii TaxID=680026 RepID=UPI00352C9D40
MKSCSLMLPVKTIKTHIARVAFCGYFVFITAISLSAGAEKNSLLDLQQYGVLFLDKMLHLGAYGAFALLASQLDLSFRKFIYTCVGLASYGLLLEYCQGQFILNREASWLDAIANVAGIILGFMMSYKRVRQKG